MLLDNPQQQESVLSPQQHLHPNAITTPSNHHSNNRQAISLGGGDSITSTLLPVTSTVEYPVSL